MDRWIKRKDFEKMFAPFIDNGTNIRVVQRVNALPSEIITIAIQLATLDFIKYIKLTDHIIAASSELKGKSIDPMTTINHPTAIGVEILYNYKLKIIDFTEINSPIKGNGSKMVDAILKDFPKDWMISIIMDWSNGFWDLMKEKYKHIKGMY